VLQTKLTKQGKTKMKKSNKAVAENHSSMRANIYIMPRTTKGGIFKMQKMVSKRVGEHLGINPTAQGVYMFRKTLGTSSVNRARRRRDSMLDYIAGLHGKDGDRAMPRFNNPDHLTPLLKRVSDVIVEEREQQHNLSTLSRMMVSLKEEVSSLGVKRKEAITRIAEWEV
jgi:hypothetical protein